MSFYSNPFDDDFNPVTNSALVNTSTNQSNERTLNPAAASPLTAIVSRPVSTHSQSSQSKVPNSSNHDRSSTTSSSSSIASSGHSMAAVSGHPGGNNNLTVKQKKSKSSFYLNNGVAADLSTVLTTGLSLIDNQVKSMSGQSSVDQCPKVPSRRSRYKNERDILREVSMKPSHSSSHLYQGDSSTDHKSTSTGQSRFDSSIDRTFNRFNPGTSRPDGGPSDGSTITFPANELSSGQTTTEYIIRAEMSRHEKEYIDIKPFKLFIGTFNVNGKSGSNVDLKDWLCVKSDLENGPPDMYAIGFQELDLSKEAYVFTESAREEEWISACSRSLPGHYGQPGVQEDYVQLEKVRLIGMMLVVFIRKEHFGLVSLPAVKTVGTGLLGTMGNKGGVSIRFDLGRTSMCFVNCHLAAHQEEVDRRNQDYTEILNRTIFTQFRPVKRILDHDQIYWFGDMNYRIDLHSDIIKERVEEIKNGSIGFEELIKYDQLIAEREDGKVFQGFKEGLIHFIPTYKYDVGSISNWDSSEKNRPPAWCDRILWRRGSGRSNSFAGSGFQSWTSPENSGSGSDSSQPMNTSNWPKSVLEPVQLQYRSHPTLTMSDHKPVSALFKVPIKIVDPVKSRKIYTELMKKLDRLENDYLPQVMLDKIDLDFGQVQLLTPVVKSFTIANTGQVPVAWNFSKKPGQGSYCKEFIKVNPSHGNIVPGDAQEVEVKMDIDPRMASKLSSDNGSLNDILVLHLERGRDLFITISGNYLSNLMDLL